MAAPPSEETEEGVSRHLRRRLTEAAGESGFPAEPTEADRRRLRRRDMSGEPGAELSEGPPEGKRLRVSEEVRKKPLFRRPANITAKNRAAAMLTKTGKKKTKHFKGLKYSFENKKKKKAARKPMGASELPASGPEVMGLARELGPDEAMRVQKHIARQLEEGASAAAETATRELSEVAGEKVTSASGSEVEDLDDVNDSVSVDNGSANGLGSEAVKGMEVELDLSSDEPMEDAEEDVEGTVVSEDLEEEELGKGDTETDESRDILLKGKARKSIPQVVLKKSFIPSALLEDSPLGSSEELEEEEAAATLGSRQSVAQAVKRRRSSVTPAVPYSRMSRGESLSNSPAGSVTGGSGGGEPAPPEGTVPAKMMDSILKNIGCKCVEAETPAADADLTRGEHFCQAIDAIDGRLVGCCNLVVNPRMVRPSVKVAFQLMCGLHRERLRRHHCCPACGLFCTQGVFLRCTHQCAPHLFHRKCAVQLGELLVCSHCGNTDELRAVQLTIRTGRTPTFFHQQGTLKKSRSARISMGRDVDVKEVFSPGVLPVSASPFRLTLPDGREVSAGGLPAGPDREKLERCLLAVNQINGAGEAKLSSKDQLKHLRTGDVEKLLSLLSQGWSPNQKYKDNSQKSPLHLVAEQGHVAAAHVLLAAGACLDPVDRDLQTPLMAAAARAQNAVLAYLVTAGAALDTRGEDGMSPLHLAAQAGNMEGCHYLLSSGRAQSGYVNQQDDGGWTPVVWASEHKHPSVVRYLLQRGANPRICDEEQNTGLHWAAFSGCQEIAELFLAAGCHVNSPNVHGDTPLHIASRQQHYQCVLLMLAHGANTALRNREGMLALDCCGAERTETRLALLLNMELTQLVARAGGGRGERVLSNDISRGKEKLPIQAVNECDDVTLPTDYVYIAENCETMKLNIDKTITSLMLCNCLDNCLSGECRCSQMSLRCWYDPEGRLLPAFSYTDPPMIFECNRACGCNQLTCNNRAVQHGITTRVQLYRTPDRGWGVRALKHIPKGTFVCEYVGELITDSAADQREDDSYLFDLDNRDGDTFCIDARRYGNVARFINHRCQPNLVPVKVFVDHQDARFPRIALFACRDVQPQEELGFDYGEKFWIIKYKLFTCKCGSEKCKYSSETIHLTLANYHKKLADAEKPAA